MWRDPDIQKSVLRPSFRTGDCARQVSAYAITITFCFQNEVFASIDLHPCCCNPFLLFAMAEVEENPIEEPLEGPEEGLEEEEDFVAPGGVREVKLFGKWSFDDIEIRDISLVVSKRAEKDLSLNPCTLD